MNLGIVGKYALVTGGSRGIGRAIALSLAAEGCNVAICARNKNNLDNTARDISRYKVKVLALPADVCVPDTAKAVMKKVLDIFPALHILVNNVGGGGTWPDEKHGGKNMGVEEIPGTVWWEVYRKNAVAACQFTMLAIPSMKRQKWGRVVTISSIYGKEAGGKLPFMVAKSAEIMMMKGLSKDNLLAGSGLTFNTVAPGHITVPGKEVGLINSPLGRPGRPEEVAGAVTFLCSVQASLINGALLTIDGGESWSY